jgi:hypothetical protein
MSRVFEDATPSQKAERNTKYTYEPPKALVCAAMQKVPINEVKELQRLCKENAEQDVPYGPAAYKLAWIRLSSPICSGCGEKPYQWDWILCPDCMLVWYCSPECREKDWDGNGLSVFEGDIKGHKVLCCQPNAPIDKGPHRVLFLQLGLE